MYYLLGDYYFKNNEMAKAVKHYSMDLRINPNRFEMHLQTLLHDVFTQTINIGRSCLYYHLVKSNSFNLDYCITTEAGSFFSFWKAPLFPAVASLKPVRLASVARMKLH